MREFLNNPEGLRSLKIIGIKLVVLLIMTPFLGYALLGIVEHTEKEWKSGNRRKRWISMCVIFLIIAIIGGWLR